MVMLSMFDPSSSPPKDYADQGLLCNPRVEDCKVLSELYQTMLKPFLQKDLTWVR